MPHPQQHPRSPACALQTPATVPRSVTECASLAGHVPRGARPLPTLPAPASSRPALCTQAAPSGSRRTSSHHTTRPTPHTHLLWRLDDDGPDAHRRVLAAARGALRHVLGVHGPHDGLDRLQWMDRQVERQARSERRGPWPHGLYAAAAQCGRRLAAAHLDHGRAEGALAGRADGGEGAVAGVAVDLRVGRRSLWCCPLCVGRAWLVARRWPHVRLPPRAGHARSWVALRPVYLAVDLAPRLLRHVAPTKHDGAGAGCPCCRRGAGRPCAAGAHPQHYHISSGQGHYVCRQLQQPSTAPAPVAPVAGACGLCVLGWKCFRKADENWEESESPACPEDDSLCAPALLLQALRDDEARDGPTNAVQHRAAGPAWLREHSVFILKRWATARRAAPWIAAHRCMSGAQPRERSLPA